jgi:hypothetical protein
MLVAEVIANVFTEVAAFGFGGHEVSVSFRRNVEVLINFPASESQIKPSTVSNVSRRLQNT